MGTIYRKAVPAGVLLFLILFLTSQKAGAGDEHQVWSDLLGRHVQQGVVDYQGFKRDEAELERYLDTLKRTDPDVLSVQEQLALYINGYNAYTVKLILNNFSNGKPVSSIRKIGGLFTSPWEISFAEIGGKTYSLDNIEHDIIRPKFQEQRIHFAVNCASKSCPPLISTAYAGVTLDKQLEKSTRAFLADSRFNYLESNTLYVSSIFKWYSEDFNDDPVTFFLNHTEGDLHQKLKKLGSDVRVKYLDYDWSLNGSRQ